MLVCMEDMGIIWNCAKYIAFAHKRVRDHMVLVWGLFISFPCQILWEIYGTVPNI